MRLSTVLVLCAAIGAASAGRVVAQTKTLAYDHIHLNVPDAAAALRSFTARYLGFLGADLAGAVAATAQVNTQDALAAVLDGAAQAGCDEFILVPATTDRRFLAAAAEVAASHGS